ncbi:flagellar protein FliS [Ammonifex degensii KC4]|uniref:Flagellar secretion chaperone FliS n=1 Tax=Ammonifex degensii (strain DSM 10501 / KC4) TaxID=429009 RepID=C9RAZ7_AMMDK|nr:flagellar export chaperone FliS [Ammonifex degensii]ACX51424.1 flagellar protein FliS [Ammonifex degensii KC4]
MEAANKYLEMAVSTAPPERLLLMLYDGAINFLSRAVEAIEARDFAEANRLIIRVEEIVTELKNSLDPQYEISQHLDRLYDYFLSRLFAANVAKDTEVLQEVQKHLRELRDTWAEVISRGANAGSTPPSRGLEV